MSPRTLAPPPDSAVMWRKLLARAHPDSGGDHELFLFTQAVRETVCQGINSSPRDEPRPRAPKSYNPAPADAADRVAFSMFEDFNELTAKCLSVAEEVNELYARLLRLLADCYTTGYAVEGGPLYSQQCRGASYKQLARIGHIAGMTKAERVQWYRVCESIPLAERHASHILSKISRSWGAA